MSVSPATDHPSTIRAVPKPAPLHQSHRRAIVGAQGLACQDIAADLDAADRLATARLIDRQQRAPLIRRMVRAAAAIRSDGSTSLASRALAAQIEADGKEAIRFDVLIDEHAIHGERGVHLSVAAGRAVVVAHEEILTGQAVADRCGRAHPRAASLAAHGVELAPCHLPEHDLGPCVFISIDEGEGDDAA